MSIKCIIRPVMYGIFLFSLFLYSCGSTRSSGETSSALDYASDVAGKYYGSGKLWSPDDVKDVDITLTRMNHHAVEVNIVAVLPAALQAMGGKKTMTGAATVSSDYQLTGKVKLMIFNFNLTGSVDPTTHTIILNISGTVMGHSLHFVLTGGPDRLQPSVPDFATDVAGIYYGAGTITGDISGDVTDTDIMLASVDNERVNFNIDAVFPSLGNKRITGIMTVHSDYRLTGTTTAMGYNFTITGTADPTNKTIKLTLVAEEITIILTGGF